MSDNQQQFTIKKIYLKDASFESPNSPLSFMDKDWQPQINVQLNASNRALGETDYEVMIDVTVTAKQNDKTAFLVEVKQAGVFGITGFPDDAVAGMLGAFCPETLFPFAREVVSDLIVKGGFPQLLLAPVNFNAMYQDALQKKQAEAEAETEADTTH
jgi:preprotein translocase subunit SecB